MLFPRYCCALRARCKLRTDRSKFVTKQGGKNMSIHQNLERPHFLMKMLEAYRTTEVADMAEDRKDDEIRNFLMRRNNLMLQACHTHANTHHNHHHYHNHHNVLLQTREDTTVVGGGAAPVESRRTIYANHRKLVEEIRVTQLGRPNPYDLCARLSSRPISCNMRNSCAMRLPCAAGTNGTCSLRAAVVGARKGRAKASAQPAARANRGTSGTGVRVCGGVRVFLGVCVGV